MVSHHIPNASRNLLTCLFCHAMLGCVALAAQTGSAPGTVASPPLLSNPPEARSPVVLTAINDPRTGKGAFSFNGREDPPVI